MYWLQSDQIPNNHEIISVSGRLLILCQHFDLGLKEFTKMMLTTKGLADEQFGFLSEEHEDYYEKLSGLYLSRAVERLNEQFDGFSKEDIEAIRRAIRSRNYLCHESLKDICFSPYKGEDLREILNGIATHCSCVAMADYLVSCWRYEFYEQEPIPLSYRECDSYVSGVVKWVLGK